MGFFASPASQSLDAVSTRDAAEALGVGLPYVHRLMDRGRLRAAAPKRGPGRPRGVCRVSLLEELERRAANPPRPGRPRRRQEQGA